MTSSTPEPGDGIASDHPEDPSDTLLDEDLEERRSRLLGIAKLFGGIAITGAIVALVVAIVVGLFALIAPRLVDVEPGTTSVPEPTHTTTGTPEPVETITRGPQTPLPFGPQPS